MKVILKKIVIRGGCRAYLDTFSDYMNPLLIEMDKAEELFVKIITVIFIMVIL